MSSNNVNKVIIVGNLGHTPELRHTSKGRPVTTLSVATNHSRMDEMGQSVVITEWHRATVWGKKAEACIKYLSKGARVYVEGELRSSKWQDQKGIDRKTPEILVEEVRFLGNGRALADPEVSENSN